MPDLTEVSTFGPVTRVETTDVALGGNEINVPNKQFKELANRDRFLKDELDNLLVTHTSGLTVAYRAGRVLLPNRTIAVIPASSTTVPNATISFVFVSNTGVVTVASALPTRCCPLARVVASGGVVTGVEDLRPRYVVLPASDTVLSVGGSGAEGAKTISANETLDRGEYFWDSLTINSGVTVTVDRFVYIRVRGDVVINGTVNVTTAVSGGRSFATTVVGNIGGVPGIGPGAGAGSGSSNPYNFALAPYGSGGGSGFVNNSAGASSAIAPGGAGGGGLIIEAGGTITVNSTAIVNALGGNADVGALFSGTAAISGSGGGSGGLIMFKSPRSVTVSGTLSVRGGNGSNGLSAGSGAGSAGGGGGGGGQVVIISPSIITTGSTIVLSGGTNGTAIGTPNLGGGIGGTFGGLGGIQGVNATAGQLITRNFIPA